MFMQFSQFFAAVLATVMSMSTQLLATPRIHDSTGTYLEFWDGARDLPLAEQIDAFKAKVVPTFPQFYEYRFKRWTDAGVSVEDGLAKAFADFRPIEADFRRRAAAFSSQLAADTGSFKKMFPDLDDNFDVYVINSLFLMDGGTRGIGGQSYFIFGIDTVARYHGTFSDTPFFHHELFHIYNEQVGGAINGDRLIDAMWTEGLAVYASGLLNPSATMDDLSIGIWTNLKEACERDNSWLANDLKGRLDSTADTDYQTYFLISQTPGRVPMRAGYYFGYELVRRIARDHVMDYLIKLSGPELTEKAKIVLDEDLKKSDL
jgi:Predicted Zn-dependent protease (DUF2268)